MKTLLIGSSEVVQSIVMPALSVDSQSTTSESESVVARLVKVEVLKSIVPSSSALVVVVCVVTVVFLDSKMVGVVAFVVLTIVDWVVVDNSIDEPDSLELQSALSPSGSVLRVMLEVVS